MNKYESYLNVSFPNIHMWAMPALEHFVEFAASGDPCEWNVSKIHRD